MPFDHSAKKEWSTPNRYYSGSTRYGNTANLLIAEDGDTITCIAHWETLTYTKDIYLTVRNGPIYDTDNPGLKQDLQDPFWSSSQVNLYDDTIDPPQQILPSVSLRSLLPVNKSSTSVVVGCTVMGVDEETSLSNPVRATSKVILNITHSPTRSPAPTPAPSRYSSMPSSPTPFAPAADQLALWQDFSYPIHTKPCYQAGCISTVAHGIRQPTLLVQGYAINWIGHETRNDTIFAFGANDSRGMLLQLSQGESVAALYNRTTATIFSEFSLVTGLSIDAQGAMIVSGVRTGKASKNVVAKTVWSPTQGQGGDFNSLNASYLGTQGKCPLVLFLYFNTYSVMVPPNSDLEPAEASRIGGIFVPSLVAGLFCQFIIGWSDIGRWRSN